MPAKVEIAVPAQEVLEEINAISQFTGDRVKDLSDDGKERKKTAQLLAIGALWLKWLDQNPPENRDQFLALCGQIAGHIR